MSPDEFHLFSTYSYLFGNKRVKSKLSISWVFLMSLQSQKSSPNPTGTNNKPLHSNRELASHIAEAELVIIPSSDGHAGFLPEVERINLCLVGFLRRELYARTEGRDGKGCLTRWIGRRGISRRKR